MATQFQPTRLEVSDRFPMLGFTVRTDGNARRYEIAIGTSPDLFGPDGKPNRTRSNFYSSRASGPLPIERGEAVYVLPPEVLVRFVGQQKLYFGLATFSNGTNSPELVTMPTPGSPYIKLSGLSGRTLQRVRLLPSRQRLQSGYGANGSEMDWSGDAATPGTKPATAAPSKINGDKSAAQPDASAHYDDGYGPLPPSPSPAAQPAKAQARSLADDSAAQDEDSQHDIGGPIPDGASFSQGLAGALGVSPEYPQASRFEPANSKNFRAVSGKRTINRVVIHITDGNKNIAGPISWFQNPAAKVSAHYIVGQDGEVVQMVKHNDIAWHAGGANGDSIGIEHVARAPREFNKQDPGMMPTEAQYCASAALVNWLCTQFNIPMDRTHVLGHSEADTKTTHTDCPNAVWDWDHYMPMVTSGTCETPTDSDDDAGQVQYAQASRAWALDAGQTFDENWNDVDVVGQPENYTCWAAAAALVVGWRDRMSMDIQAMKKLFTSKTGVNSEQGLYAYDDQKLANTFGLVAEGPQCYTVEGFRQLLRTYGPLWVGIHTEDDWGHAVVVTGMFGDGTEDGTYVRITDPWGRTSGTPGKPGYHNPTPGQGSRYAVTYSEFTKEYEAQASGYVQILHALNTGLRTIEKGADQSYALSAGMSTQRRRRASRTSYARAADANGAQTFDENWNDVDVAGQPENYTCWAAAAALVVGWRDRMSMDIQAMKKLFTSKTGVNSEDGLYAYDDQKLADTFGLVSEAPQCYTVEGFRGLLRGYGPLWVGIHTEDNWGHAVVVTGMFGDGTEDGTFVRITDPWGRTPGTPGKPGYHNPTPGQGSRYAVTYSEFTKEYEGHASGYVQILHSANIGLRTIEKGADQTYALSAGISTQRRHRGSRPAYARAADDDGAAVQPPSTTTGVEAADVMTRKIACLSGLTDKGRSVSFVQRYLRDLTRAEAVALSNAGLQIVSCHETGSPTSAAYFTRAQGKRDGRIAFTQAQAIDQPAETPIYFAVDFDTDTNTKRAAVLDYFQGVQEGCDQYLADMGASEKPAPVYAIGVYGPACILEACRDQGIATWFWQAFAPGWCNNRQLWPGANIHTYGLDKPARCDMRLGRLEGWGNEGGWQIAAAVQTEALGMRMPDPPAPVRYARGQALDGVLPTVSGSDGNVSWELEQYPGLKLASSSAAAPLQSAETIRLTNWPYCEFPNGTRAAAWFKIDWKYSGQSLGQITISPAGVQQGPYPLRVEAGITEGKAADPTLPSLTVTVTYRFSAADGGTVVAETELTLYSDGSMDQKSHWIARAAA